MTSARLTEAAWQTQVMELAVRYGWLLHHNVDSRREAQRGFPDWVFAHPKGWRVVYAELKRAGGQPTLEQCVWIRTLAAAGEEIYLWRPADLPEVVDVLSGHLIRPGVCPALPERPKQRPQGRRKAYDYDAMVYADLFYGRLELPANVRPLRVGTSRQGTPAGDEKFLKSRRKGAQ